MNNEDKRCWNCLRRLRCNEPDKQKPNNQQAPDCHVDMVTFDDDITLAINTEKGTCEKIYLFPDLPDAKEITLDDLRKQYGADLVIHEDPLHGEIYKYGNHGDFWEQIGTTEGYA